MSVTIRHAVERVELTASAVRTAVEASPTTEFAEVEAQYFDARAALRAAIAETIHMPAERIVSALL